MGGLILPRVAEGAASAGEDSLDKFGQPLDYTYLTGLYLAVNAIPDATAVIDGPDCVMGKAEHVHGKHDWHSTLLDCTGRHRIGFTGTDVRNTIVSREKAIRDVLVKLKDRKDLNAVLFGSMPMCLLTGTDYEKVARESLPDLGKPVFQVPSNSLRGFLLDGYAETLLTLAKSLDLAGGERRPEKVAVVGYFMDRLEQEHQANVRELKRLLAALSLDLVSVWLGGGNLEDLRRVREAGIIVALPYGLEAARTIASRTGAKLVEAGLPLGVSASRRWLEAVGEACGHAQEARAAAQLESARVENRLASASRGLFKGRRCMLLAEPHALSGLAGFVRELGAEPVSLASVGRVPGGAPSGVLERPTAGTLRREWDKVRASGVDLVVCNSDVRRMVEGEAAVVEFGYPSYFWHALSPRPFLGFEGVLGLAARMGEALERTPARPSAAAPRGGAENLGLEARAAVVPLARGRGRAEHVVLAAGFADGADGARLGNAAELERLLAGLGLSVVSTWLSDSPPAALPAAGAGTVISLPDGRGAGALLARRLKARHVETGLPCGLEGTSAWLRAIGKSLDLAGRAEALIDAELAAAVPRLEWVIPFLFLNKRFAYAGDPRLFPALAGLTSELGARLERWTAHDSAEAVPDLLIGDPAGWAGAPAPCPTLELGFPAPGRAFVADEPFLGFAGAMALIDRLAGALSAAQVAALGATVPAAVPEVTRAA